MMAVIGLFAAATLLPPALLVLWLVLPPTMVWPLLLLFLLLLVPPTITLLVKPWWLVLWLPALLVAASLADASLTGADGPGGFAAYAAWSALVLLNGLVVIGRLLSIALGLRIAHRYVGGR